MHTVDWNLNGAPISPGLLAAIATVVEEHGSVTITIRNAAKPIHGPGLAALILGNTIGPELMGTRKRELNG